MVYFEVPLPPGKERFYIPAQLVDQGDLFGGEVKTIRSNPIGFSFDRVADKAQRGLRLIHPLLAKQHLGVEKDDAAGNYGIGFKTSPDGFLFDAADEMLTRCLELVEVVMALISPIGHCRFSGLEYLVDERPFSAFAGGEENLSGNTPVEVKTDMGLGLFCSLAVVGPLHGKAGV